MLFEYTLFPDRSLSLCPLYRFLFITYDTLSIRLIKLYRFAFQRKLLKEILKK